MHFTVDVGSEAPAAFAQLSGDWNPLHTNAEYAARTTFGRPVLHGAYMMGLMSRLAGMYLPGEKCLLHGMSMRFIAPVHPPVRVSVIGTLAQGTPSQGRVAVRFVDADTGTCYADGHYDFGLHTEVQVVPEIASSVDLRVEQGGEIVLVTGATGGLAHALLARLPEGALGVSRSTVGPRIIQAGTAADIERQLEGRRLSAIVHCAWPAPDNAPLTGLQDVHASIEYNLAAPIREAVELAQLLKRRGTTNAALLLIGSSFAAPGRHNYRMPIYTIAKSAIPALARVLAMELASSSQRCMSVVFDVIDGGMNRGLGLAAGAAHRDRSPYGRTPSPDEAAQQLVWVLGNQSFLASGATLQLTGGAIP